MINLLVILFTLAGIRSILLKKNGLENSLQWIILGFVLGYRTFEPVPGLKLHPIEVFVYACIIRIIISNAVKYRKMSLGISMLGIFFITYFFVDLLTGYHFMVLLEFKNAFLLVLVFFIAQHINFHKAYIIRLLKNYLIASSIISILGITEYLFPSIMSSIFGFKNQSLNISENIIFTRLAFLFWGSNLVANLIPPVFPILLLLKVEKDSIAQNNYFLTFLIIINLFAIYLSGNRISWLTLTILLLTTIFQYRNFLVPYMKSYTILLTLTFVAYVYSQPVEGRYISTFKAFTGQIDTRYDSSGGARMARANIAIDSIVEKPLGTGWGSQGWVHSDVLQIAASVGIIPGIIFLIAPLFLLFRMYRGYLIASINDQTVFFSCCGLLIFVIISLSLNGNILKVQTGVPLFVLWAITDGYCRSYSQGPTDY
jgi:hypothetical protein